MPDGHTTHILLLTRAREEEENGVPIGERREDRAWEILVRNGKIWTLRKKTVMEQLWQLRLGGHMISISI